MINNFVDKEKLLCDNYRALILCEYSKEMVLIRCLITMSENAIESKAPSSTWSFEGICHLFAKSILSYAKMAYDNMILGHFDATYMIVRAIIENNVCLDIMQQYEKEELWKYYIVQSYKKFIMYSGKDLEPEKLFFLKKYIMSMESTQPLSRKARRITQKGRMRTLIKIMDGPIK